jgi:hypothetical protein
MAPVSPTSGWEDVLASFEATLDEAAAALVGGYTAPTGESNPVTPITDGSFAPPSTDRDDPAAAEPALTSIDPRQLQLGEIPDELRPRAQAIRARQERLADRLSAAMLVVRRQQQLAEDASPGPRPAVFLDRRV